MILDYPPKCFVHPFAIHRFDFPGGSEASTVTEIPLTRALLSFAALCAGFPDAVPVRW